MPEPGPAQVFLYDTDSAAPRRGPVATAELLPDSRLRLLDSEEGERPRLEGIVERLNAMPVLQVQVSPPESAERYKLFERELTREDPEFLAALREHLEKYHGLRLSFEAEVPAG